MTNRNVSSWLPNLIGPDTILVDGEEIAIRRDKINLVGATQVDDADNNTTDITISTGAPKTASYVTLGTDANLTSERVLTAGTGISVTDGGAGGAVTVACTVTQGAPTTASYVTLATNGTLTSERVLTAGTGITLTDNGAGSTLVVAATGGAGSSGSAGVVQTADGAGGFTAATNVLAGSGYISVGSTPAGAGLVRIPYAASGTILGAKDSGGTDRAIIKWAGIDYFQLGDGSAHTGMFYCQTASVWGRGTLNLYAGTGGNEVIVSDGTNLRTALPIGGYATSSKPMRFMSADIAPANTTLTAAQYECVFLKTSGVSSGAFTWTMPDVAGATFNIKNVSSHTMTVKKSGGTGFTIAAGVTAWAFHNGTDYEQR